MHRSWVAHAGGGKHLLQVLLAGLVHLLCYGAEEVSVGFLDLGRALVAENLQYVSM